jgi:putative FmdB family regulatory protein
VPTYQYACTECDHRFEAVQSFTEDALAVCPACGGRLRKVFNSVGIVFKGSGFYRNDSREKAPAGASSDGKAGASEGTKDAKPDSKAAAAKDGGGGGQSKPAPAATPPASSGGSTTSSSTAGSAA